MGWWPESVLYAVCCTLWCVVCVVCVVCPAMIMGWVWGCDAIVRESGCEAVRVAVVCVDDVDLMRMRGRGCVCCVCCVCRCQLVW